MSKNYYSLGLMSGTSMDGVDASIIQTNGKSKYKAISDKYFAYPKDIYQDLTKLRDKIKKRKDLKKFKKKIGMEKIYTALGLISGTSLDGIVASIVRSDGEKFILI